MREMLCGVDRHPASGSVPWSKANREAGNGQSISPDGTGGFMTEQEKAFEEWWSKTYHPWTVVQCARDGFLAGYAAGERAARQECAEMLGKTFEETGEIQYLKSERMVKATIKEPTT
jgi:hypothetical protein